MEPSAAHAAAQLPGFVVERPRLLSLLDEGARGRLTLVLGPSGTGKSVLVRQWVERQPSESVATLSVDVEIIDAISFGRQLVSSVAELRPGFGEEALRHLKTGGARMGQPFLQALVSELAAQKPIVLVIDDLQEAPPEVAEELGWLVTHAPAGFRLVVASQTEPQMLLGRLRAQGQLTEVRASTLAFEAPEAAQLVEHVVGRPLSGPQLHRLRNRTEGWAVGLQLASLALRNQDDVDGYLTTFSGANRDVADYLTEEVLRNLPSELRSFLWSTSVLDRLNVELCNVLTGHDDGHEALAELERRALFLVALDSQRGWYRYHHLFAEVLRYHLRTEDPRLYEDLLERAARWHLEHDDLRLAIEYLLRAERWQEALDLIGANGWTFFERGDSALAIRWLEAVPLVERRRHGQAEFTLATLYRLVGNTSATAALLDELERDRGPGTRGAMGVAVLRAGGIRWDMGPEEALANAEAGLAWFGSEQSVKRRPSEPSDEWIRGSARLDGARALLHLGRWEEAREWLSLVLDEATPHRPWRVRSLGLLACLEATEGNLEEAYSVAQQALKLAGEAPDLDVTSRADAHLALSIVAYERSELDTAEEELRKAETQVRVNNRTNQLAGIVARQARVSLAQGQPRRGLELLVKWRREGNPPPPADVVAQIAAVEAQLLWALRESSRAKRVLARSPHTSDTLAVAARIAASEEDWSTLALVLDRWPGSSLRRSRIEHLFWRAVAASAAGDDNGAAGALRAAVRLAEVDGHCQVLLEGGPQVLELLRGSDVLSGSALLGDFVDALVSAAPRRPDGGAQALLSEKETVVLAQLGTLLSNQEIAEKLMISRNTLKTHLRRIYRKLGVTSRRGALVRAEELGLRVTSSTEL